MNYTRILTACKSGLKVAANFVKKNSDTILFVTGIIGVTGSTVLACKETIPAKRAIDLYKDEKESIKQIEKNPESAEKLGVKKFDAKEANKDNRKQLTYSLIKCYWKPVLIDSISLAALIAAYVIQKKKIKSLEKRVADLSAAYVLLKESYDKYRGRVRERYGEDVEREIYEGKVHGSEEDLTDEERAKQSVAPDVASPYARVFDTFTLDQKGNVILNAAHMADHWTAIDIAHTIEAYFENVRKVDGFASLADIYRRFGFPITEDSMGLAFINNPVCFEIDKFKDNFDERNTAIVLDFTGVEPIKGKIKNVMKNNNPLELRSKYYQTGGKTV